MTVMIKSWTGVMVTLRVGMGVRDNETGAEWVVDEDNFCQCCVDNCTMISCPFAVGDEVERIFAATYIRSTIQNTHDLLTVNRVKAEYRHANPNLRTKPDGNV